MDTSLAAVLIGAAVGLGGSVITLIGSYINNRFLLKKDAAQWARQQEAEKHKRRHEEKLAEREKRRDVYQNVLRCLTTLAAIEKGTLAVKGRTICSH
jgi:hypothetical protein